MLSIIWACIIICSCVYAFFTGNADAIGNGFFEGAQNCVSFILKTGAIIIMWQGMLSVAEKSRLMQKVTGILSPLISKVFSKVDKNSKEASLIAANVSANMLGLSNAATPLGIKAMKALSEKSKGGIATNDMCLLAVLNCASVQLVPSTLIALRSTYSSSAPGEIIVPVWIASALTLIFSVILAKTFEKFGGKN